MSLNGVWSEKIDKIVTFGRPSVLKLVRSAGSPNVPGDCPINYISQHLVARADPCDARNWVSQGICHPGVNQPTRGVKVRAGWMIYDPDLSSIEHEHQVSKKRSTSTVAIWNGSFGCKTVTEIIGIVGEWVEAVGGKLRCQRWSRWCSPPLNSGQKPTDEEFDSYSWSLYSWFVKFQLPCIIAMEGLFEGLWTEISTIQYSWALLWHCGDIFWESIVKVGWTAADPNWQLWRVSAKHHNLHLFCLKSKTILLKISAITLLAPCFR